MITKNPLEGLNHFYRQKRHPQAPQIISKAAVGQ